jgi:ankyrin repeat protein
MTMTTTVNVRRSPDQESLAPLIELCKAGRLFEVQDWIAAGKPVNPPPLPTTGRRVKTPLLTAIDLGFHSLVEVLLKGGAVQEPEDYDSPMNRALGLKRLDIVGLLVDHGFDPRTVDMQAVFQTWEPRIMEYFIERGADIKTELPFAHAFCSRIRTVLRIYKQCREKDPELQEQANIALRYHCKEGNPKWVSLMLWAGADPYACGRGTPWDDSEECGQSAIGYAAIFNRFDILRLKQVRLPPENPEVVAIASYLCEEGGIDILKRLLDKGLNPNDRSNGGCTAITNCLMEMTWERFFNSWGSSSEKRLIDSDKARGKIKAIHLLAKHGAKWIPDDTDAVNYARRSLLQMAPDYTVEFVWIMSKFKACSLDSIKALLRTPKIKAHVAKHSQRIQEMISSW